MYNMYNNVAAFATESQEGKYFEADLLRECQEMYVQNNIMCAVNTKADICEGTDMFWNKIRIDITANFSGKNHIIRLAATYNINIPFLGEIVIRYGIRTGNNRSMFQVPVLVVGFDLAGNLLKAYHDAVVNTIRDNWKDIMDQAEDLYWEFDDKHPGFLPDNDPFFA